MLILQRNNNNMLLTGKNNRTGKHSSSGQTATRIAVTIFTVILLAPMLLASKSTTATRNLMEYSAGFASKELGDTASSAKFARIASKKDVTDKEQFEAIYSFSRQLLYQGKQTTAFEFLRTIMEKTEGIPSTRESDEFKSKCLLLLGACSDEIGMRHLSMDFYLKGMSIAEKLGDNFLLARFYNNIGVGYFKIDESDRAYEYFHKSLELNKRSNDKYEKYINYCNISEVNSNRGKFKEALNYALEAIQCLDVTKQPLDFYSMQAQIGDIYTKIGNREMGRVYLDNAYRNLKGAEAREQRITTCIGLADYHIKFGAPDSAQYYTSIGIAEARAANHPGLLEQLYRRRSQIAAVTGDYKEAYEIQKLVMALSDSIEKAETHKRMDSMQQIYNIEREASVKELPMAKWNPIVVFVSMGLLIVALIALFLSVLNANRKKNKADKERFETESKLKELSERQLEEEKNKNLRILEELHMKHRNMTNITLEKIQKTQQIGEIERHLKLMLIDTPTRDKERRDQIRELIRNVSRLNYNSEWKEFHYYFELVHPSFYNNLNESHPDLTDKERRLCALLSLGMNTKDIASVTSREVRSVESSRNRLRKKLGISSETSLIEYVRMFSSQPFSEESSFSTAINNPQTSNNNDQKESEMQHEAEISQN